MCSDDSKGKCDAVQVAVGIVFRGRGAEVTAAPLEPGALQRRDDAVFELLGGSIAAVTDCNLKGGHVARNAVQRTDRGLLRNGEGRKRCRRAGIDGPGLHAPCNSGTADSIRAIRRVLKSVMAIRV